MCKSISDSWTIENNIKVQIQNAGCTPIILAQQKYSIHKHNTLLICFDCNNTDSNFQMTHVVEHMHMYSIQITFAQGSNTMDNDHVAICFGTDVFCQMID